MFWKTPNENENHSFLLKVVRNNLKFFSFRRILRCANAVVYLPGLNWASYINSCTHFVATWFLKGCPSVSHVSVFFFITKWTANFAGHWPGFFLRFHLVGVGRFQRTCTPKLLGGGAGGGVCIGGHLVTHNISWRTACAPGRREWTYDCYSNQVLMAKITQVCTNCLKFGAITPKFLNLVGENLFLCGGRGW